MENLGFSCFAAFAAREPEGREAKTENSIKWPAVLSTRMGAAAFAVSPLFAKKKIWKETGI